MPSSDRYIPHILIHLLFPAGSSPDKRIQLPTILRRDKVNRIFWDTRCLMLEASCLMLVGQIQQEARCQ